MRASRALPSRAALAVVLGLVVGATAGCHREPPPSPETVAYKFRDVFPYPAITGGSDVEVPELAPLRDPYLTYVSRTDFSGAADQFAAVADRYPDLLEARLLQGISLVLAGRDAEAVEVLESVVSQRPDYAPARWFLGQALLAVGRRDDGLDEMREVVALGDLYASEAAQILDAAEARR